MTDGNEWDMEIRRPEVENVTLGCPANDCVIMFCRMTKNKQTKSKQKQRRIYRVAQNKIPNWRICNISISTIGCLILKILEAA